MAEASALDEAKLRTDLLQFVSESKFIMAVSMGRDGYPMARTLGYLNDDFNIWLYTVNQSLKMQQFRDSSKITLLWREPTPHFFKFLTMKGNLEIFEDAAIVNQVWERYQAKYYSGRPRQAEGEGGEMQRIVIKVKPVYLRAEGFGFSPPPVLREF